MKRNYKYEAEMLHWLDGGEIEVRFRDDPWEPFDGQWVWNTTDFWQYRIAEPAEKQRWLYVNDSNLKEKIWLSQIKSDYTIGKIRMEEI